jgi:hypothetical protein
MIGQVLGLMITLLLSLSCVYAQEKNDQIEDNSLPYFLTMSVYPLDQGTFEIIVQPQYNHGSESDLLLMPQLSYGITDNWQIFTFPIIYDIHTDEEGRRTSGNGDIEIGTLYSWMHIHKSEYSAGLMFNLHIPTASLESGITDGLLRYEPSVLLTRDIAHKKWITALFTQVGFEFVQRVKRHRDPEDDDPAAHAFVLNLGIAERSERVNYSLELNWKNDTWNNEGESNELYVTPGVYVLVKESTALGLAVPIGLTQDSDHYQIIATLLVDLDTIFSKKKEDEKKDDKSNLPSSGKPLRINGLNGHILLG